MFAIICLNVMLLISCWYLIAENQKNKSKINGLEDDLNKAIKRLSALEEEGVTRQNRDFIEIDFVESPPQSLLDI